MELSRYNVRVHMGIRAPKCTVQRRGKVDTSRATNIPYVLLDPRAGIHGNVGVQAVERGRHDQGSC